MSDDESCERCPARLADPWDRRYPPDHEWHRWCARCIEREKARERSLLKKYGITGAAFAAMLAEQENRCAICRFDFGGRHNAYVDHDHATGKVRGLLCAACNFMVGQAADSPERLRRAADYLEQPPADEGNANG